MKFISKILGIIGIICLLSAAGNDDLGGCTYPLGYIVAWSAVGLAMIGIATVIWLKGEQND